MNNYLGETKIDISESEYKDWKPSDWALLWIEIYGDIDGAHHKDWVLDQVARILNGVEVQLFIAKWENGETEERFRLAEPSAGYLDWVQRITTNEDGEKCCNYDFGIAP